MTLSEGQLPFLSNLILSTKFCDFGFGLVMGADKSHAGAVCTCGQKRQPADHKSLGPTTCQNWARAGGKASERQPLKLTFNGPEQRKMESHFKTLSILPD